MDHELKKALQEIQAEIRQINQRLNEIDRVQAVIVENQAITIRHVTAKAKKVIDSVLAKI